MNYKILRPPLHDNFELPLREQLLKVTPGQLVKIIFQAEEEKPERMWVKVVKQDNGSEWGGVLDNDPEGEKLKQELAAGDEASFHPLDIIQVWE